MQISSKLPHVGTSIFTVMSALAREHNAINLSQGFPDFNCDPKLVELTARYTREGFNQYAPMQGVLPLREQIARMMQSCYNAIYHPEHEITVTAGATQGIFTSLAAFLHPGDEAIVFEPCYDCYIPGIEVQGAKAIPIEMTMPSFRINWELVRQKVNDKTRVIIINSPHNPSGTTLQQADLLELESIVKNRNIVVISDEVYEHMTFGEEPHQSVARFPTLREQSIVVSSFGKTVHTTGWKIGYVAAPQALMAEFRKVHQFLVFSVNHPFQLALADYLAEPAHYTELKAFYRSKRDYFLKLVAGSRFQAEPCAGTYFQLMSYKNISQEKDTDLAIRLTKEHKVASIPLSVFYTAHTDHHYLRFCFAKKEETLEKAAEILCRI